MSHRRARHLNFGHCGAANAPDARFITGLNDGDAMGTLPDRSINAINYTGTGATKPTFETREQGGNPVVRMGTYLVDSLITSSVNLVSTYGFGAAATVIFACKNGQAASTQRMLWRTTPGGEYFEMWFAYSDNFCYWDHGNIGSGGRISQSVANSTDPLITSCVANGSNGYVFRNGTQLFTAAMTDTLAAGSSLMSFGAQWLGDLYAAAICPWSNEPLRRRIEQSMALAWKIKWN